MPDPSRVRDLIRVARNAPIVASVATHHLRRGRWHSLVIALRALSPRIRQRIVIRFDKREPSATAAAVLFAAGRTDDSLLALEDAATRARPRQLCRLIATAAALDAPEVGERLITKLPRCDPRRAHLQALLDAQSGRLSQAARQAAAAGWRGLALRRQLASELDAHARDAIQDQCPPTTWPSIASSSAPITVLHLVTNSLPEVTAGYTVRTQGIVAAQRRLGLDAHVSTRLGFPVTVGRLSAGPTASVDGVPYHRRLPSLWLPANSSRAVRVDVEHAARVVERLQPAIIHAHSKYLNAQVALKLRERFGIPVVYEVRGFLEETWRSRGRDSTSDSYVLSRRAETQCMAQADALVTLSEGMKASIVERGIPAGKVAIVPNAVDDTFLAEPPDPGPLRLKLGVRPNDLVLGTITTVNSYEGLHTLIDAVAHLRAALVPARLLIVGDGPALAALRQRARDAQLGDAIFTGRVPFSRVREYHGVIDIFCTPRSDTPVTRLVTPLKPLEAMASGRPVVASDLPPLREIVNHGQTGYLCPPGDPVAVAEIVRSLLYNSSDRARIGAAARLWVTRHRTWSSAAAQYHEIYRSLGESQAITS